MLKSRIHEIACLGDSNRQRHFYAPSDIKPTVELTSQLLALLRKAIDPDGFTVVGQERIEERLRDSLHFPTLTAEEKEALNRFLQTWNWSSHTALLYAQIYKTKLKGKEVEKMPNEGLYYL